MTSPLDQKIRIKGPVVITANRLTDGAVVYRRADGGWTDSLAESVITTSATHARELLAAATSDEISAVGAYIAPVKLAGDGKARPGNLRELIRAGGPTIAQAVADAAEPADVCL
jgi:hypothetical protein